MEATLKIGRREYTITGTKEKVTDGGQRQVWTNLRGKRGAQVTLVETFANWGVDCHLIHFGRFQPSERIESHWIKR